jgi:hypothetical protein
MNNSEEFSPASNVTQRSPRISPVLIALLKGVLYREQQPILWNDLKALEGKIVDYFKTIGLNLMVDEAEGFAFLKQSPTSEAEDLPRLIHRRPLSYPLSLLCVLLRKKMAEADAGGMGSRVVLEHHQIVEMMRLFLPRRTNEASVEDRIETNIQKAVGLDLLRPLKLEPPAYEVRPIVKALVDGDWLANLDEKLKAYQESVNNGE